MKKENEDTELIEEQMAEEFLKIAPQYKLGMLVTEAPHPNTIGLSTNAMHNLPKAINQIKSLDLALMLSLNEIYSSESTKKLITAFKETLASGKRIFLCGCGATGRLSLAIETLWRQHWNSLGKTGSHISEQIVGFMAGGDVALIKSVEDFEDHTDFAPQQLIDLRYEDGDLLIASTESGVTPWVIGAAQYAAGKFVEGKSRKPFFVYCNPDKILIENVERTKEILLNPNIEKLNVCVGPMAVTGSTRMQASTAVMYLLGLCLFIANDSINNPSLDVQIEGQNRINEFYNFLQTSDLTILAPFIEMESSLYKDGSYIFYETDPYYAISVLTDTTERSPTFSLNPFENINDFDIYKKEKHSLCYLLLAEKEKASYSSVAEHSKHGWTAMLAGRDVRPLCGKAWEKYATKVSEERIYGHLLTQEIIEMREKYCRSGAKHVIYDIDKKDTELRLYTRNSKKENVDLIKIINIAPLKGNRLEEHVFLKIILNIQSTLVMGRLGRYESNLMTYVRPSNNKLVDRSIRYITHLLNQQKTNVPKHLMEEFNKIDYKRVCYALFKEMKTLGADEPIVLKTFNSLFKPFH